MSTRANGRPRRDAPPAAASDRLAAVRVSTLLAAALIASLVPVIALVVATSGDEPVRGPVRVTLEPNVEPVAVADEVVGGEGLTISIDVTANDEDENSDLLVVTGIEYDSGNGATVALAENLLINGDGALGSNANFSSFTYAGGAGVGGSPAFLTEGTSALIGDQAVALDTNSGYVMSAWARAEPAVETRQFAGVTSYDADGEIIRPFHVAYGEGSETELARDLAPGDTRVHLVDSSGWADGDDLPTFRNIVMYPYTDRAGTTYPPYTYSRNVESVTAASGGLWERIEDDVVTLRSPWDRPNPERADGVWPAGTPVANARTGGSFNFNLVGGNEFSDEWVRFEGTLSGVASGGDLDGFKFRPGTSSVRFAVLPNQGDNATTVWFSDIELREAGTVTYTPAPGFVGTDTFRYVVSDLRGDPATATVTVDVRPNSPPAAADDLVRAGEGLSSAVDVLANDADGDGDVLRVTSVEYTGGNGAAVELAGNLVRNGDGQRGTANFSGFEAAPAPGPDGLAAFVTSATATVFSDDLIPVDISHDYTMRLWSRAEPNVGARHSAGFAAYDADRRPIAAHHVNYARGSETQLARDLAPGDREVHLVDGAGWLDGDERAPFHNIVMYPYTSPTGVAYPPYTYSRHTAAVPGTGPGLWRPGGIDGNVIRLIDGWARPNPDREDGVWPAGTPVANATTGAAFNFTLVDGQPYVDTWTEHEGSISGVAEGGTSRAGRFPPGTAFVRVVVVPNRGPSGGTAWYSGFELVDLDAPPVTYTPAPGFSGTDGFTYEVGDGRGGIDSATVTVEVVPNSAPVTSPDEAVTAAGEPVGIDVLANDRDPDGDELTVVAVRYESGNGATVRAPASLLANGDGAAGDASNFPGFRYVAGEGPDGGPAFFVEDEAFVFSEEPIPVDTGHVLLLTGWSRGDPAPGARHAVGFASFDADGQPILAHHVAYAPGSETELARDLVPGDEEIHLADAAGWLDGDEGAPSHNIVMYPYTTATGETHPPYTYSRHTEAITAGAATGLWRPGAIDGDVITLVAPWDRPNPGRADGVWPAGTPVANALPGVPRNFALVPSATYTAEWTSHSGVVVGVMTGGVLAPDRFRPGTAYIRFVVARNVPATESTSWYADLRIADLDALPVVYEPAAGFTGTDTVTYVVEDARGARTTGTIEVVVGAAAGG